MATQNIYVLPIVHLLPLVLWKLLTALLPPLGSPQVPPPSKTQFPDFAHFLQLYHQPQTLCSYLPTTADEPRYPVLLTYRKSSTAIMAPDSPPVSPLSPPPSWFRDEDTECPHFERPHAVAAASAESTPSSPLSPAPAWFNDNDTECPHFGRIAAESWLAPPTKPSPSTIGGDGAGHTLVGEPKPGTVVPLASSPTNPFPASRKDGDSQGPKRPFEWLDSENESPAKRARSEEEHISNVSDITSPGDDSGVTEANGPRMPFSPPGEPEVVVKPEDADHIEDISLSKPEVWATLRGGLCEALPYFRAYKGSLHTQDRTAIGFLVDKEASVRDVFNSQIIISSV